MSVMMIDSSTRRAVNSDGGGNAANNSLVNSLSISLKHNGTASRLGLFDCSLSGVNVPIC